MSKNTDNQLLYYLKYISFRIHFQFYSINIFHETILYYL
jgi:hypothetical protein